MANEPARVMRLLKTINEKLDLAITGHGDRIQKLETGHADHESRLTTVERTLRWVVGKIESHAKR